MDGAKFAEYLRENYPGVSDAAIGKQLGVSRTYISLLRRSERLPGLALALRIERWSNNTVTVYDWGHDEDTELRGGDTGAVAETATPPVSRDVQR